MIVNKLSIPVFFTGKIIGHPETDIVASGTMANFNCTVNSCNRSLRWIIGTFGSEDTLYIPDTYADNDHELWSEKTCESNRRTATLGIVASSNSVIQCEEYVSGSKKLIYSKFAMLIVEPQHEGTSHYIHILIHYNLHLNTFTKLSIKINVYYIMLYTILQGQQRCKILTMQTAISSVYRLRLCDTNNVYMASYDVITVVTVSKYI